MHPVGAGVLHALAHNSASPQIGSCAEDDGPHRKHGSGAQHHLLHPSVFRPQVDNFSLPHGEALLPLQRMLHHLLILPPIRLRPERMHRRPLAPVEHPVLDAGRVCRLAHLAAQSVQLPDQMTLARAADGRVAGHIAHGVQINGEDDRLQPHPCRRQRRLDAGVSGADDSYIKFSRQKLLHGQNLDIFVKTNKQYLLNLCKTSKKLLHSACDGAILPME